LSDAPAFSDEPSSDVLSSSFIEDILSSPPVELSSLIDSSLKQLVRRSHHLRRSPDCYYPLAFTITALSEPAAYHDVILHPEWQHVMVEEIVALEWMTRRILCPVPHVFVRSLISVSIRLRLALMVLLSAIRLVSLLVVFSRSKIVIMMRLLFLLLI
jgi:hypothetical protein